MTFTINRLVSLNNHLNIDFIKHINTTNNICLYKLGNHYIPSNVFFPNATSLTLINCNKTGIVNIFTPAIFPNLINVNYMSTAPGDFKIYERFNDKIKWVFPNKTYDFYDFMVETGRGKKDSELIKQYTTNKKLIDGKNGFDISFEFDLNIPEYGIINGEWWCSQFYEYLVKQQNIHNHTYQDKSTQFIQETEELELENEIIKQKINYYNFNDNLE